MKTHRFPSANSGFNLVEILIALVILAFGLLGIASLQITGVRGTQSSYYRSQAVNLANDMAERMYGNRLGVEDLVKSADYDQFDSKGLDCSGAGATQCAVESQGTTEQCTEDEMASYDVLTVACGYVGADGEREGGVNTILPGGRLLIECIDDAGAVTAVCPVRSRRRITVQWSDRGDEVEQNDEADPLFEEPAVKSVVLTVQP